MSEKKNRIPELNLRKKPEVPHGYFDHFYADLWEKIQEEKPGILDQLKKSKRPELPEGYFETVSIPLEQQEETSSSLPKKAEKPTVPEAFFENFEEEIVAKVAKNEPSGKKGGKIISILFRTVSIAAVLLIGILAYNYWAGSPSEELVNRDQDDATEQTSTEELFLTYLDEADLVDLLVEDEWDEDQTETERTILENFSTEDLEDYYLEEYLDEL